MKRRTPLIIVDTVRREVIVGRNKVPLSPLEFSALHALARANGNAVSRESLFRSVWKNQTWPESRTVDMHIANIRKSLGVKRAIETIRDVGYRAVGIKIK